MLGKTWILHVKQTGNIFKGRAWPLLLNFWPCCQGVVVSELSVDFLPASDFRAACFLLRCPISIQALCFEIILISELEGNRQFIAVSVIITSLFRFHKWHIKLLETILKQLIEMNSTSLINFKVIITQRSHLKRKEIRSVTATPTFVFPRFIL